MITNDLIPSGYNGEDNYALIKKKVGFVQSPILNVKCLMCKLKLHRLRLRSQVFVVCSASRKCIVLNII